MTVNVSELDVRVRDVPGSLPRKYAFQKSIYNTVAAACRETRGCEAVTSWGFTDAHTWIDAAFGLDEPLQFDANYVKKPAYFGEMDGLDKVIDAPPSADIMNLVDNPSFETNVDGWVAWGATIAVDPGVAHAGTQSAIVTNRTATFQGPVYTLTNDVQTGDNYTATAWVQIATTDPVILTTKTVCDSTTTFSNIAQAAGVPGQWVQLSGTVVAPSCNLTELDVYVNGAARRRRDIIIDDVFVPATRSPPRMPT